MLSLLRLERKPKSSSNSFRIRIFLFLSYSFGIETINTFILSRTVPSKTIPNSRQKWVKCIPVFRPKQRKNPTRWGGTCLYSLYKGVPPPRDNKDSFRWIDVRYLIIKIIDLLGTVTQWKSLTALKSVKSSENAFSATFRKSTWVEVWLILKFVIQSTENFAFCNRKFLRLFFFFFLNFPQHRLDVTN